MSEDFLKPGELKRFTGSLVKCLECGRVDALVTTNDFMSLDARGAGWHRKVLEGMESKIFDGWTCPNCVERNPNLYYTAVAPERWPINRAEWKAPTFYTQLRQVSRPVDFEKEIGGHPEVFE